MRRVLAPLILALLGVAHVVTGGCSSSTTLAGGGGCEAFCNKWVGARCRNGPTKNACMEECLANQGRCRPETNALLKCATIEAQIACETGSGQPRIVGCGPRELAQAACLSCDRFCERWSELRCNTPGREECVATCLDPRCATQHARVVDCMSNATVICDDGQPRASQHGCEPQLFNARLCTEAWGQPEPFKWLPVQQADAAAP